MFTRFGFFLFTALVACAESAPWPEPLDPPLETDTGSKVDTGEKVDTGVSDTGTVKETVTYACEHIAEGHSDGFFTLHGFQNRLYAGSFGYGNEGRSMIYRYPEWEWVTPGLKGVGESICALQEYQGSLYANTENSGDIFRSANGRDWERVYDGPGGSIGCGLAEFKGQLYAINYRNSKRDQGRILRQDGSGWHIVYDSGSQAHYLRELVTYGDTLYAFGVDQNTERGLVFSSKTGASWSSVEVPNRYFRGHVWEGYLWLGSTDITSSGEVGVFRFDGEEFVRTHSSPRHYVADLKDLDGHLFLSTSNGWKGAPGPSGVWMSVDGVGAWEPICEFSETAAWNMAVVNNELYVGTWEYGGTGSVYHVKRSRP